MKTLQISSLLAFAIIAQPLSASLLVYEGFNYGLSNGVSMNGVTSSATGLTGDYKVTNSTANASTTFAATGLSFGSSFFATAGGALALSQTNTFFTEDSASTTSVRLNTGAQTGTLYQSYLFRIADLGASRATTGLRLQEVDIPASGSLATFSTAPDGLTFAGSSAPSRPGVAYQNANSAVFAGNTTTISTAVTYLGLARFTNAGTALSAGTPGVATFWVLNQTGYENWLGAGGADEANLSTYATWTATQTLTSGTILFNNDRYQHFFIWSGTDPSSSATTYDELRWGTTLQSVAVIPEPATAALILPVALFLLVLRQRRRCAATARTLG